MGKDDAITKIVTARKGTREETRYSAAGGIFGGISANINLII